ncbi:hypothetical protein NS365_23020, partial [Aureimonas ureilytica]
RGEGGRGGRNGQPGERRPHGDTQRGAPRGESSRSDERNANPGRNRTRRGGGSRPQGGSRVAG